MKDLRPQKQLRTPEETLTHLKGTTLKPQYSAGVWYFYPGGGRFHEAYIDKGTTEDTLNKVARLHDEGYVDSSFAVEAHYPNEVNRENLHLYRSLEKETGIKLITAIPFLFYDRRYEWGSLSNPDPKIRRHAISRTVEALQLNREQGTEFAVVWPGIDGYENPFGHDYYGMWTRFEAALAEAMDAVPGVRVALEPKPYEPRGNNIYRNTANGLLMARDVEARLMAQENTRLLKEGHALVGLNPEVGHVLMGHEELAYSFASVLREGRLMHSHWNSQPLGNFDQDLNVGVLDVNQMLAALLVFKLHGYDGYYGVDINPERMPVERALVLSMNALDAGADTVNSLDYDRMVEAMYDPAAHRGVLEDVLTRALAPDKSRLRPLP
ncbi:MAG: TIM barrel protein [Candidatus Bathyarchaeota archaeon]